MMLRATETPIAIVVAPPTPAATERATASTVEWIGDVSDVLTDTAPEAVSPLLATVALARPLIWFSAVAPPPEKPNALLPAASVTLIALARELASIEVASVTSTFSAPAAARASATSVMDAWTSLWLSLRDRLRPTATDVPLPNPAPIAIAGATTWEVTSAVDAAVTLRLPPRAMACA